MKYIESDSIRYVSGMEVKCNITGRPVQKKIVLASQARFINQYRTLRKLKQRDVLYK